MFYITKNTTDLDTNIGTFFSTYKDEIMALVAKDRQEEKFCGLSEKKFWLFDYYLAMYYAIMIYHVTQYNKDYEQIFDDFCYEDIKKCLSCSPARINLDTIFDIFNLTDVYGKESPAPIEYTLTIPITELLSTPDECSTYFDVDVIYVEAPITSNPIVPGMVQVLYGKSSVIVPTDGSVALLNNTGNLPTIYTTLNFPLGLNYLYIGIPVANVPQLNNFLDIDTMFGLATHATTWDFIVNGVNYRLYRSEFKLSGSKNIQIK